MLVGHGWMCWNGAMPLRALLWDEGLLRGVVESWTGLDWGEWVASIEIEQKIDAAIRIQAWLFFLFATLAVLPTKGRLLVAACALAALNLMFLAWLKYHDSGRGIGELVEHLGQVGAPLVLALWGTGRWRAAKRTAMVAIACTFVGHGLFALDLGSQLGWANHPRPGQYTEMVMLCLGIETESAANRVLVVAGVLDILVVMAMFLAAGRVRTLAIGWMAVWGLATAVARPWAYFEPSAAAQSLSLWIPEALFRVPHFGLPLFLLLAIPNRRAENADPPCSGSPSSPSP